MWIKAQSGVLLNLDHAFQAESRDPGLGGKGCQVGIWYRIEEDMKYLPLFDGTREECEAYYKRLQDRLGAKSV